jgi:predicted deacylase
MAAIKVGEWADGSAVGVPVHIVNGREPGPVVAVTAAIHGDEVVGTDAVRRIISELDPARLPRCRRRHPDRQHTFVHRE